MLSLLDLYQLSFLNTNVPYCHVEDLLAQEFSIKCGKIFGISLSPLKDDIYVFSVVGHMLDT